MLKLQKRCQSMKSNTSSLKTLMKELLLYKETFEKKDLLLHANKLIKKIPDPRNAKENYQLYIRKKNRISGKQSEIIEISNIVDTKSIIEEHPKTLHKLS